MTNEKRTVLFVILMVAWMIAAPYLLRLMGLNPEPRKPPPHLPRIAAENQNDGIADRDKTKAVAQDKAKAEPAGGKAGATARKAPEPAGQAPGKPEVELVNESELVLGSATDKSPGGYRLEVQLDQKGGGVDSVFSSRYDAEFDPGMARKRPLQLMGRDPNWPPSLALTLNEPEAADGALSEKAAQGEEASANAQASEADLWKDLVVWEVVRDDQGRTVRPIARTALDPKEETEGRAIVFRTKSPLGVVVTKTFRLWKGCDWFEVEVKFESPGKERPVVYNLLGPHGIRIEGEWYTSTFRDVVFAKDADLAPYSAYDVANAKKDQVPENITKPLSFAGVENQYFATLIGPDPPPKDPRDRWDARTIALVLHKDPNALQKADVSVGITSRPIVPGPGQPVVHSYRVFAGPKIADVLKAYGPDYHAERLASYHKSQWFAIPLASELARFVIAPTLAFTYKLTTWVSQAFGGSRGNYGIAIILLTMIVRGLMFPLGRKQARVAQKMQELQPQLKEIQEKYKDDKERSTREMFALYKKHGNPQYSGCLPALIQLPIFVGLWQALNTSVSLRHASFLWIRDLAAPDMMFRFPFDVPFLGQWFNLLPFVVISLMLLQTKLFSPPPTTQEAEMQQKMMKYMMVFMGVMFYKVPSGLGIYFITSSLWAIGERLLLPKVKPVHPSAPPVSDQKGAAWPGLGSQRPPATGPGTNGAPEKPPGKLTQFLERVLEEARKDATHRKMVEEREAKERESRRTKDKGKPRAKPGRR
jgi:YidC/Oxa1 family membrane protein insertase